MGKRGSFAEFFAKLASLKSLNGLPERQFDQLARWYAELIGKDQIAVRRLDPRGFLPSVYHLTRLWLGALMDSRFALPVPHDLPAPTWHLEGDRLVERYPKASDTEAGALLELLRQRPFPFRRCKSCDAIFVRQGKRLCCSSKCTATYEKQRRKTQKRREDQAAYQAALRREDRDRRNGHKVKSRSFYVRQVVDERKRKESGRG